MKCILSSDNKMSVFTSSFLTFLLTCISYASTEEKKRLLLNDPTYFEKRISHLETMMQQQDTEISSLKQALGQKNANYDGMFFIF